MRIGPHDRVIWLVVDPTGPSEPGDLVSQVSLAELALRFRGDLTMASNPTLFTDRKDAEIEAFGRVSALRAAHAIAAQAAAGRLLPGLHRLEILDSEGKQLFSADLD